MQNYTPVRKRPYSLAHELVAVLTQQIMNGKFKPGEKLPSETELVREQGVSRTVVREAISNLQASGLVETRHGIGTFVLDRPTHSGLHLSADTSTSVRAIIELRMGLEAQAAALAAERRSENQLFAMMQALEAFKNALSIGESYAEEDMRFHMLIAEAADNSHFTDIMQHIGIRLIPRTCFSSTECGTTDFKPLGQFAYIEHQAILNAIRRQNPEAAKAAMLLHLTNSLDRFCGV